MGLWRQVLKYRSCTFHRSKLHRSINKLPNHTHSPRSNRAFCSEIRIGDTLNAVHLSVLWCQTCTLTCGKVTCIFDSPDCINDIFKVEYRLSLTTSSFFDDNFEALASEEGRTGTCKLPFWTKISDHFSDRSAVRCAPVPCPTTEWRGCHAILQFITQRTSVREQGNSFHKNCSSFAALSTHRCFSLPGLAC